MKTLSMNLAALLLMGSFAQAATNSSNEYEVICRAKAKEVAAETYRGCVSEARSSIDQLKKDYQERLKAMKEEYEKELKRLSAGKLKDEKPENKPEKAEKSEIPATTSKDKKSAKKVAKGKLPPKKVTPVVASNPSRGVEEMTVELKPASSSNPNPADESVLDIPEPTAVEEVPTAAAN